jgi:hypothetical protein
MTISTHGLIGAVLGLAAAFAVYSSMQPLLQQMEAKAEGEGLNGERPKMSLLRLILLSDFVILAGFGYFAGQMFE